MPPVPSSPSPALTIPAPTYYDYFGNATAIVPPDATLDNNDDSLSAGAGAADVRGGGTARGIISGGARALQDFRHAFDARRSAGRAGGPSAHGGADHAGAAAAPATNIAARPLNVGESADLQPTPFLNTDYSFFDRQPAAETRHDPASYLHSFREPLAQESSSSSQAIPPTDFGVSGSSQPNQLVWNTSLDTFPTTGNIHDPSTALPNQLHQLRHSAFPEDPTSTPSIASNPNLDPRSAGAHLSAQASQIPPAPPSFTSSSLPSQSPTPAPIKTKSHRRSNHSIDRVDWPTTASGRRQTAARQPSGPLSPSSYTRAGPIPQSPNLQHGPGRETAATSASPSNEPWTSRIGSAHPSRRRSTAFEDFSDHSARITNLWPGMIRASREQNLPDIPKILPHEKVFPIQIGSDLFRLSGASISSDAPSYFSQFFERQLQEDDDGTGGVRTLYIDRDPVTFHDISRHLQGYHVTCRDGSHFVKLFADAQFYSLPRLISQLFESEIFIQIGHRHFQIPRDIFSSPGDSPNFFSLGFGVFFSTPGEVFPGLNREGLLRPPSILPPSVANRSADVFADLLQLLRGYPLHIRNPEHRAELLRDCRYFQFRGLEQKLIPCDISYNLKRGYSEVSVRIEDIRPSGVSFTNEPTATDRPSLGGWVRYARPFIDDSPAELVVEIGGECTRIDLAVMRADFQGGQYRARVSSLFQVVANKMNLPTNQPLGLLMMSGGAAKPPVSPGNTPLSEDQVKVHIDRDTHIVLDGDEYFDHLRDATLQEELTIEEPYSRATTATTSSARSAGGPSPSWQPMGLRSPHLSRPAGGRPPTKKRKRQAETDEREEWIVRTGQWRLRIQPCSDPARGGMEVVMVAVKLDVFTGEHARNARRSFLGG
ncbi:MAG: hypothetical protein M1817_002396 [Caeruleum heppii]|nr:MAG: hypothetical protein M1817_002396 [Caeruleum heppii]